MTDGELATLNALTPATHPARDATHFRAIIAARGAVAQAEEQLRQAVQAARAAGDSWTVFGAALDTSKQAAQQRFGIPGHAVEVGRLATTAAARAGRFTVRAATSAKRTTKANALRTMATKAVTPTKMTARAVSPTKRAPRSAHSRG